MSDMPILLTTAGGRPARVRLATDGRTVTVYVTMSAGVYSQRLVAESGASYAPGDAQRLVDLAEQDALALPATGEPRRTTRIYRAGPYAVLVHHDRTATGPRARIATSRRGGGLTVKVGYRGTAFAVGVRRAA